MTNGGPPWRCGAAWRPTCRCCPRSVPRRCRVLGVDRGPRERHVVLPADQPADHAERGPHDIEGRAVAHAPHRAFAASGHELAVPLEQPSVGPEVQQGVVQRAALDLVDAHRDVRQRLGRGRRRCVNGGAGHARPRWRRGAATTRRRARPGCARPSRGRRDERLGKDDQLRALPRGLLDQRAGFRRSASRSRKTGVACTAATVTI